MQGRPRPRLFWYKESEEIVESEDVQILTLDEGDVTTSQLVITEVQPEHAGEYTVQARNKYGVDTTITNVTVIDEGQQILLLCACLFTKQF